MSHPGSGPEPEPAPPLISPPNPPGIAADTTRAPVSSSDSYRSPRRPARRKEVQRTRTGSESAGEGTTKNKAVHPSRIRLVCGSGRAWRATDDPATGSPQGLDPILMLRFTRPSEMSQLCLQWSGTGGESSRVSSEARGRVGVGARWRWMPVPM